MRLLLLSVVVAFAACTQSEQQRYEACEAGWDQGESFDFANTDSWRLNSLPFWTTPDQMRGTYGAAPDSQSLRGSVWSYRYDLEDPVLYTVIGDTLAYPAQVHLLSDGLETPDGTLQRGATAREARELFPRSYQCRDYPLPPHWSGDLYDSQWIVWDSLRQAEVVLYFKDAKLLGLGVDHYEPGYQAQQEP